MNIEPFGVEIWMNEWETKCEMNLAETCVESITIAQLLELSGRNEAELSEIMGMKMTYGAIRGSERLLTAICGLYEGQRSENVIVTHGAIGANSLVHKTLVGRGDKVVAVVPTYQQHYSIPQSLGADVHKLVLREEDHWLPDLGALREMVTEGTKLIAINNPNNPTGALMDATMLGEIAEIARGVGAYVLCDEVYRGVDQTGDGMTASIADIYELGVATGSMSKAFSLAGLRLGWIAAPVEVIEAVSEHRDYDTIAVGRIDDFFATMALENKARILERSQKITRGNLAILEEWIDGEPLLHWVKPKSGTTTLVRFDLPMTSKEFCVALLQETGVMFTPGSAFDMEGYVRVGYANNPEVMKDGLARVSGFLNEL
jgi:aspartate/methionine/tyrosine aminotransferase